MIGSAIRKPRIHPGRGSARADSMIEGRTMVMGTIGLVGAMLADQGPFAQGLGEGVGVGPAEGLGRALPASTSWRLTQSSRSCSARSASRWRPAAPSSSRACLVKRPSRSGWRDSASRSARSRRALATSAAPVDVER